jgi:hypothetical protein
VEVPLGKLEKKGRNGEQDGFEKDVPRRVLAPNIIWRAIFTGVYNSLKIK